MTGPKGFFGPPKKKKVRSVLPGIVDTGDFCNLCKLHETCNSPKMPYTGEGRKGVLWLAMCPGKEEDRRGEQLVGSSGIVWRKALEKLGYNPNIDFWKQNVVNCFPWRIGASEQVVNRDPTPQEIRYCRPTYWKTIKELNPSHIFLLGGTAVSSFFLDRSHPITKDMKINRFRGLHIPDPKSKAWIHPIFHPSYINRNEDAYHVFERDIKNGLQLIGKEKPSFPNFEKMVVTTTDKHNILSILRDISEGKYTNVAIDYETSGLKPQKEGHLIHSVGLGVREDLSFSFPLQYPGVFCQKDKEEIENALVAALIKNKWVAHNIQMEERWNRWILGVHSIDWNWCTMNAAHIIDERPNFCSLDFQVFINWGFEYGGGVSPFKSGEPFNNMHRCPLSSLLKYNGLDSLFTKKLYEKQKKQIGKDKGKAGYSLTHKGILAFCDMESTGFCIKENYYEDVEKRLEKRVKTIEKKLLNSHEGMLFQKEKGKKISLNSPIDLSYLMYDILKLPVTKRTPKGKPSVDAEVLEKTENSFFKLLVKMRKIEKIRGTYLQQFKRETEEGKIYPNLNLHLTRTYRSSSDSPNWQNLPKHDKRAMRIMRDGIIPSPGNILVAPDYGSMEVRIIAIRFNDPILQDEMTHEKDPHGMWAKYLGLDKQRETFKDARYDAKNAFVFALFYGSYYGNIHKDLVSRGYRIDEGVVKSCEKLFWDKYKVLKRNQEKLLRSYQKTGFVSMPWGHKRRGFLSRNQVINTYIQGPAFHCLLWSLARVNRIRKEEQWETKIPGQIHDEILFDLYPPELEHVMKTTTRIMTEDIRKENPWITIPLKAEWSKTEIDGSWATIKDIENV